MNNLQHLKEQGEHLQNALERLRGGISRIHVNRRRIEEEVAAQGENVQRFVLDRLSNSEVAALLAENKEWEEYNCFRQRYNRTFADELKFREEINSLEEKLSGILVQLDTAEAALKEKVAASNLSF